MGAVSETAKVDQSISGEEFLPNEHGEAAADIEQTIQDESSIDMDETMESNQLAEEVANNATAVNPVAVLESESLEEVEQAAEAVASAESVAVADLPKEINGIRLKEPEPEILQEETEFEIMMGPPP